jgi:hypothetical protein
MRMRVRLCLSDAAFKDKARDATTSGGDDPVNLIAYEITILSDQRMQIYGVMVLANVMSKRGFGLRSAPLIILL